MNGNRANVVAAAGHCPVQAGKIRHFLPEIEDFVTEDTSDSVNIYRLGRQTAGLDAGTGLLHVAMGRVTRE